MEVKELDPCLSSPPFSSSSRWWSKDTIAIVTGANKGIGFALVKQFSGLGLTVILTARDVEKGYKAIEKLRRSHGGDDLNVHLYRLDVSDSASIKAFVLQFKKDFGVVDILVNNAAVSFNGIHDNTVDHAETVIKTNYYGAKLLIESLLPIFRRSNSISRILNMSSRLGSINKMRNPNMKKMLLSENLSEQQIEGMVSLFLENVKNGTWESQGWPRTWTDYAVSKLALNAYSRVLARQYKDCDLSINCFCPGFTQTSMTRGKGTHTADAAAEVGARLALLPPQEVPTGRFYVGFVPPSIVSRL
ncbi:(+)-neomenthol dehydrogenase [Jatropha curcas]|uniref:(+)-neomenthol dehydrogenase n=1 Tax=Jatropha curcas TaxID=180498 RepID=UPI0005FB99B1|nr:(+)-neomenthol dehydrogenase [Jatropha curcas]